MERGVTSRARKSFQGREEVPDPRYGGRPGQRSSKWQPTKAPRPAARAATPAGTHRIQVTLPEHLYEKLMDIVAAERSLRREVRYSPSDRIAELIRAYEVPAETAEVIAARRRR